jgi:uncharacterized protein YlaI
MSNLERGIRCSFCDKKQEDANKIISSPPEYHKPWICYICDECVASCVVIIEKDKPRESKHVFGIETGDLERMESLGFITTDSIRDLSGSVLDFLLQLWNMLASAKSKLNEVDRNELAKQISKISNEVLMEGQGLDKKKAVLEALQKKLASIQKTASK